MVAVAAISSWCLPFSIGGDELALHPILTDVAHQIVSVQQTAAAQP